MTQAIPSTLRQPSLARRSATAGAVHATGEAEARALSADVSQSAAALADQSVIAAIARDGHLAMLSRQSSTSASAEAGDDAALDSITRQFQQRFRQQAGDKDAFHELMRQSFGDRYDRQAAESIRQRVLSGDFSWMPKVTLVDSASLQDVSGQQGGGVGKGAYSAANDTVYLSRALLAANPAEAERILTEEVGHALDTRVNVADAAGDEGEIFSRLSHGEKLSASDIAAARAENDSGTIVVDGQRVEVEFGLFKSIKKGIKKIGKAIKKGVKSVGKAIKKGVSSVVNTVKKGFKAIMQSSFIASIMSIAQFIPIPIVQVVARVYNIARAAYSVYQGVKHGSAAAILGGVAGIAGGVAGVAGRFGASASFVNGAQRLATTARTLSAAYAAVARRDWVAAAGFASNFFGGNATTAGQVLGNVQRAGIVYQAARRGDIVGAVGAGADLMQQLTGPEGDRLLRSVADGARKIQGVRSAIEQGDYALALSRLNAGFGDAAGLSDSARASVDRLAGTLDTVSQVNALVRSGEYAGAASLLLDAASRQTQDPAARSSLLKAAATIQQVDRAVGLVEQGEYREAIRVIDALLGTSIDSQTQQVLDNLEARARRLLSLEENPDVRAGVAA